VHRFKRTGDTRLPEAGEDRGGGEEYDLRFEPAEDIATGTGTQQAASDAGTAATAASRGYVDAAREQVRQRPLFAVAGAFALGYLFARI
jgi:hypothetical protein